MIPTKDALCRAAMPTAKAVAGAAYKKTATYYTYDEVFSEILYALAASIDRWPTYCDQHSYDPSSLSYFVIYARRRMMGVVKDKQRTDDPYSRAERHRLKSDPDAIYQLPVRGQTLHSFLPPADDYTASFEIPTPKHTQPEQQLLTSAISEAASAHFLALPLHLQELIAYMTLKPPSRVVVYNESKIFAIALKNFVIHTLDSLQIPHPPIALPDFPAIYPPYTTLTAFQPPHILLSQFISELAANLTLFTELTTRVFRPKSLRRTRLSDSSLPTSSILPDSLPVPPGGSAFTGSSKGEAQCRLCRRVLPLASYYKTHKARSGHYSACINCTLHQARVYQAAKRARQALVDNITSPLKQVSEISETSL